MNQPQGPDRSSIIGIVLISVILGVWMIYQSSQAPPPGSDPAAPADTSVAAAPVPDAPSSDPVPEAPQTAPLEVPADSMFAAAASGTAREIVIVNDRYEAVLSTQGATLTSFRLQGYSLASADEPVQLVSSEEGAVGVVFTPRGGLVDTRTLYFEPAQAVGDTVRLTDEPFEIAFDAPIGAGSLRFVYTFHPDDYELDFRVQQVDTDVLLQAGGYEVLWDGAIPFSENNPGDEAASSGVYVRRGGGVESYKLKEPGAEGEIEDEPSGAVDWIAVKSKYFVAAINPPEDASEGADIYGLRTGVPGQEDYEDLYQARVLMDGLPAGQSHLFHLYLGPMDLSQVSEHTPGLYDVVDYGFGAFITRPIAEYVIAPLFRLLGGFIPNYGVVIILFAALVKLVLYPLTKSAYTSTARMREVQPQMEAIKEKHGDNPQKQQEAMMRLYKEEKINPLGGCLPLLLQYPIIIALWRFFQNSILIRQESFLWAADLSAPDPILRLPFEIPLYGDFVAGFCLIMGIAMVVQMRFSMPQTGSQGAQAKIFMYVLPVILFAVFNKLASGLSLYYLAYNVLTVFQQRAINRQIHAEKEAKEAGEDPKAARTSRNGRAKASANGTARKRARK